MTDGGNPVMRTRNPSKEEYIELFAVLSFCSEQVALKEMPIRCLSHPGQVDRAIGGVVCESGIPRPAGLTTPKGVPIQIRDRRNRHNADRDQKDGPILGRRDRHCPVTLYQRTIMDKSLG